MKKTIISENLNYHLENDIQITENVFRHGSESYFNLITEVRNLYDSEEIELNGVDRELYESTDIGMWDEYEGNIVPLDLPMEEIEFLTEAEYQGKDVRIGYPMRGGSKKYYVYVKNPKTGKVKKISFGDTTGLSAKVSNPEARKRFASRHRCKDKKDRMTAGYWACRVNRYGHLWGGKTYPGYW